MLSTDTKTFHVMRPQSHENRQLLTACYRWGPWGDEYLWEVIEADLWEVIIEADLWEVTEVDLWEVIEGDLWEVTEANLWEVIEANLWELIQVNLWEVIGANQCRQRSYLGRASEATSKSSTVGKGIRGKEHFEY